MRGGLPALLIVASLAGSGSAEAQVTVNPGALDLLQPQSSERRAPRTEPQRALPERQGRRSAIGTPEEDLPVPPIPPAQGDAAAKAATAPTAANTALPQVPAVPPAIAALPPPAPVPAARAEPPPPVPFDKDAPGEAEELPGGVRITFAPQQDVLNATTAAALRGVAQAMRTDEQASVTISAYAAGTPEDPSSARRLSLERALAARAALIGDGIESSRIYPRALGATGGDGTQDRADVVVRRGGAR